jgi:RNA polymerase sigma-70 factor (ECF subfamily)
VAKDALIDGEADHLDRDSSDEDLVRAFVQDRDEGAFRTLYRRHAPALYGLALRLHGGARAPAEDAMQEAWVRAAERFSAFRFESAVRTWLVGILINCSREGRRRAAEPAHGADGQARAPAPDGRAVDLERAIAAIAEGYRRVFLLHDLLGYTHREIASLLGVDEGTSKSQLFLARRALRQKLALPRGSS